MDERHQYREIDSNTIINGQPIGLFNFTNNDLKKQTKISLEDIGVLAYGNFIFYEPERMKWFKEFEESAETRPDDLVWKLLRVRKHLFEPRDRKPIEEPKNHFIKPEMEKQDGIFEVQVSAKCGINPHTVGFIVSVKEPKTKVWYKLCEDRVEKYVLITKSQSFNFTYPGSGIFRGYFIARDKNHFWRKIGFEITVDENSAKPGDIITNFYQGKAVGIKDLDVCFSIASGRALDRVDWIFDDENPPPDPKKKSIKQSAHNSYKHKKTPYTGKVIAWDYEGNRQDREFQVIIGNPS